MSCRKPKAKDRAKKGMVINMKEKITKAELLAMAKKARESSYSPYSGISVGAALLCEDGSVFLGTNIENAAYSPCICAERAAFASAVTAGERKFSAIAVVGGRSGEDIEKEFPPCGVCRQVMQEFCNKDFEIILSEDKVLSLGELLPFGFDFK